MVGMTVEKCASPHIAEKVNQPHHAGEFDAMRHFIFKACAAEVPVPPVAAFPLKSGLHFPAAANYKQNLVGQDTRRILSGFCNKQPRLNTDSSANHDGDSNSGSNDSAGLSGFRNWLKNEIGLSSIRLSHRSEGELLSSPSAKLEVRQL